MNQLVHDTINDLTWIKLILLAFGAYSVTRFFVTDSFLDGVRDKYFKKRPYEGYVFEGDPRIKGINLRRGSGDTYTVTKGSKWGELLVCPWCFGFWVSLGLFVPYALVPEWTLFLLIPLSLRAFVGAFANKMGG